VRFGQEPPTRFTSPLVCLALATLFQPLARAEPLFPLTVQLDWIENAQFAGLLVAKEKGWYTEQGLDVTIEPVNQTTLDTVGPVVRGRNVIGCADGMVLLRARQGHQPIQAFATMLQASPLGIVTDRGSHLNQVKDLAGKTIGLHAYDVPQLDIMLKANGLTLQQVKIKKIGDDITSLAAGQIDAQVVYLLDEKVALEEKGMQLNVFPGYANDYNTYSQVYFARADFLQSHRDVLAKFLLATNRGWEEAFAHPNETASMLVSRYLPGKGLNYQALSLVEIRRFATIESPQLGQMRLTTWQKSCAQFHLDPALAEQLANFSVLHAVYRKNGRP
jgi:ABC-type nitrate/sulfonate/bicarbonate transport system substrate-binding protein